MQLIDEVFKSIVQLYDCLLTEVHERCKKGLILAKKLNSSLAYFCYDLLSVIDPRQVFELVHYFLIFSRSLTTFFWRFLCSYGVLSSAQQILEDALVALAFSCDIVAVCCFVV